MRYYWQSNCLTDLSCCFPYVGIRCYLKINLLNRPFMGFSICRNRVFLKIKQVTRSFKRLTDKLVCNCHWPKHICKLIKLFVAFIIFQQIGHLVLTSFNSISVRNYVQKYKECYIELFGVEIRYFSKSNCFTDISCCFPYVGIRGYLTIKQFIQLLLVFSMGQNKVFLKTKQFKRSFKRLTDMLVCICHWPKHICKLIKLFVAFIVFQ